MANDALQSGWMAGASRMGCHVAEYLGSVGAFGVQGRVGVVLGDAPDAGEWEPGERLPAVAGLAQHYGVARNTVIKALRRMADDGLVEIVPNWGTFRARN